MITYEEAYRIFRYDEDSGKLYWKISPNRKIKIDDEAGTIHNDIHGRTSYVHIKYNKKIYKAHRLAYLLYYKELPNIEIDHIDGDGLNNRIVNLTPATRSQQCHNMRKYKRRDGEKYTSNYTGVGWSKWHQKWKSQININSKKVHLGFFKCEYMAYLAYEYAKCRSSKYSQRHGK